MSCHIIDSIGKSYLPDKPYPRNEMKNYETIQEHSNYMISYVISISGEDPQDGVESNQSSLV